MSDSGTYKIKPAGRHILTIGRDLIQDCYAAVVELVKNAYDADSSDVNIEFKADPDDLGYSIIISDHGHGMSRDTVINKWMVPSTRDKLDRHISPSGRIMQGRKGVGRYAASILGKDLLLETVTSEGEKTTVFIEWSNFEDAQYLDDVEILIDTKRVAESSGTRLTISGDRNLLLEWDQRQFDKLRFELKKLISPVSAALIDERGAEEFRISLMVDGFPGVQYVSETVEPYPIFDLFDYKITGRISSAGNGILTYSLQKARNTTDEEIQFDAGGPTGCGELVFDIRVYDREKEAIESLIARGLKDESGTYVGKLEARQLLNEYNGIGVYRNGFRIRPLGDAAFDWVELNKRRVQNPSKFIGSDQAIGYVLIQSEEKSGLVEKSARDGLKSNNAYNSLKRVTTELISKLEEKRLAYRIQAGLSRSGRNVDKKLEKLFSVDELKRNVKTLLTKNGIDKTTIEGTLKIISQDTENRNNIADEIRQTVAIYQGQATLGKIINVILHEGRRPLNYFRNQIPNLRYWYESFQKTGDLGKLENLVPIVDGIGQNAEFFVKLFGRLDPLAAARRSPKRPVALKKTIKDALDVFEGEIKAQHVIAKVIGPDDFKFLSWPQDIYAIITNLVDNSLYWINEKKVPIREIRIDLVTNRNSLLYIDYHDTGPGIEPSLIASEVIFEPQFSTKPSGTGLGLAIAGEAAIRNGLELKAFESEQGAYFRLQPKSEEEK